MGDIQVLAALGLPLAMVIGVVAAWRMSKRDNTPEADKSAWRDDSLDDWRRDRDRLAEEERLARETQPHPTARERTGSTEERETTEKHQRIGG